MSAPLSEGDSILVGNFSTFYTYCFIFLHLFQVQSFTYKATECAARRIAEQKGFLVRTLDIKLPIKSDEDIIQLYADELEKYPDIRMIILGSLLIIYHSKKLIRIKNSQIIFQVRFLFFGLLRN